MSVYYGQDALEGFGRALSIKLDIDVVFTTGQPRTDGNTIYLPSMAGVTTLERFEAMCGVAVHEASHVHFRSTGQHQNYHNQDPLRAACYNAAIDVADECRIIRFMPRADALLRSSNKWCLSEILDKDLSQADPVWLCLAWGILRRRLGLPYKGGLWGLIPDQLKPIAKQAGLILQPLVSPGSCKRPRRTPMQWHKIRVVADKLVDLLKSLGGTGQAPGGAVTVAVNFGPAGTGAEIADGVANQCVARADAATRSGHTVASQNDGADSANVKPDSTAIEKSAAEAKAKAKEQEKLPAPASAGGQMVVSGNGASFGGGGNCGYRRMTGPLHAAIKPYLGTIVERMAEAEDVNLGEAHTCGAGLAKDLTRVMQDGAVFTRRAEVGENLNMVIALDASGSMDSCLNDVQAVAQAMLEAVTPIAENVWCLMYGTHVEAVSGFASSDGTMGGTGTAKAIKMADRLLEAKSGRKILVVITDGEPDSKPNTMSATRAIIDSGVSVIAIGYGRPHLLDRLRNTMPGASLVGAATPSELAIRLASIVEEVIAVPAR